MARIPTTLSLLRFQSTPLLIPIRDVKAWRSENLRILWFHTRPLRRRRQRWIVLVRASEDSLDSADKSISGGGHDVVAEGIAVDSEKPSREFDEIVGALPPAIVMIKNNIGSKLSLGICVAFAFLAIAVRQIMLRRQISDHQGSVADLVRRGQIRSDRRGISMPLKYEDPFNNPLVKTGKSDSTIEMCGKVYRLAPVTLTKEEQSVHQKRRSRAYQWKRPTVFLKEGDSVPPNIDPDTIRWIPANHPFATTVSDIDEDMAQSNVRQKHGVPFRVKAEHEAMQRKLEALQSGQKLNKVELDPNLVRNFERPLKSSQHKSHDPAEPISSRTQKRENLDPSGKQALLDEEGDSL